MKQLILAISIIFSIAPTMALSATDIFRIPVREEKRQYQLLRDGKMGVDIGFRSPLLLYGFAVNRMASLSDASTEVQGVFERKSEKEFYYFSQQLDEKNNLIVQTLEGYSLETFLPRKIFSETLYSGPMYGDSSYFATFSKDEKFLYTWKQYDSSIEAWNLETKTRENFLKLVGFSGKRIAKLQNISFQGSEALAIITDTAYEQGEVWVVDVKTKSLIAKFTGYDFQRRDAIPGSEPYNIVPSIDRTGKKGIFCDHDACVVVDLVTRKALHSFSLKDGNNSSAQFSPDGTLLFACDSVEQTLSIKKASNGKVVSSTPTEICTEGETTQIGETNFVHNFSQVFSISKEGKVLDVISTNDPINAYDDVEFLSSSLERGVVFTVDWQGSVKKHRMKVE